MNSEMVSFLKRFFCNLFCLNGKLTGLSLALLEGVVDVDESEMVALGMLEFQVALHCLGCHADRWFQKAAGCYRNDNYQLASWSLKHYSSNSVGGENHGHLCVI